MKSSFFRGLEVIAALKKLETLRAGESIVVAFSGGRSCGDPP